MPFPEEQSQIAGIFYAFQSVSSSTIFCIRLPITLAGNPVQDDADV
ncbi:Uncharacterised protein [Mycobacteroides abscessus]|nr:Uncharacterised protein [Mycobacteroides abscessus]